MHPLLLARWPDIAVGEHVDILGRASLNDLILRVAGGKGELIEENILSRIREYSDRVKIEDDVA
jgi:phospholipid:diacylglycerol acyltransferase